MILYVYELKLLISIALFGTDIQDDQSQSIFLTNGRTIMVLIDYVAKGKIRSLEIQLDGWRCMYAKIINRFPTPSFLKLFSHFSANSDATSFSPNLLRTSTTSIHHFIFITKRVAQVLDTTSNYHYNWRCLKY